VTGYRCAHTFEKFRIAGGFAAADVEEHPVSLTQVKMKAGFQPCNDLFDVGFPSFICPVK
jgi:hypothetical protein